MAISSNILRLLRQLLRNFLAMTRWYPRNNILQEIFSASNSKINKKDLRPVGLNSYKTASGKYTSKAYGFEGNVGYQFSAMDGINLMPNIGII
ncbi:autotransporter outer membrane beta-barrel domain-containing protein [Rickettsia rhipicephali]|nr:autotransporter outer membrane beta-barrel domain-containing protein [Rickettsia rhipicephali]